ncbi:MAG: AAA family ATPase [bacterium]
MEKNKTIISLEGPWAAGKTTILKELRKTGLDVFSSVVPTIYEINGKGDYSPRKDAEEFTKMFLKLKEDQLDKAIMSDSNILLFDRVFFAPIVLRKFLDLDVPGQFYDLAKNENICKTVFLIESIPLDKHLHGWPRKHFSYEESLRYYKITEDVIYQLGFQAIKIPYSESVKERVEEVLKQINKIQTNNNLIQKGNKL